ncbi:LytTR family transcriptional regulator [Winogradskyella wandonensis]|uniref:LytTR family transcriptional regulator n=1 Tax=Winogradskyella wandonensis TaxID=1442586 RepID=A0A4R1KVY1_9FLAO|nr:LytTR family DNA-binding domain-containing protein [Winogradskyella wandonensis]TCK69338.1 LytTR family transcriptional regulator [Winogradskyella wandonensis]
MKNYPFDPLLKHHVFIGLITALWVFVFLFFTEPLDVSELGFNEKLIYLPGYGLIAGLCYIFYLPVQNMLYRKTKKQWTIITEILFLASFSVLGITIARLYYLYVVVANEPNPYSLSYMLKAIFLPAIITILPIIIIGRYAFGRYHEKKLENQKIEIKGEGNYEGLRLDFNDIIAIKSSDNYVEVFYINTNSLKKTLIRNKLSAIDYEFENLHRAHRSYLVNLYHFQQWKVENSKHIMQLNYNIEVPVSKTYLASIKSSL